MSNQPVNTTKVVPAVKYPQTRFIGAWATVYHLEDERGRIFYVGCTTQSVEVRLSNHIGEARSYSKTGKGANPEKSGFIIAVNYKVSIVVIDMFWLTGERKCHLLRKAAPIEELWINRYFLIGHKLTNKNISSRRLADVKR